MDYSLKNEKIADGVRLLAVETNGFKTACVSVSFVMDLGDRASLYALVPSVLTRSSAEYPDLRSIEKKLANLYGADIVADVTKTGEHQIIKIGIDCIDDRFALDGESVSRECCELLFELIFNPRLVDGAFELETVLSEKRMLLQRLAAESSDKKLYAKRRCEEMMFSEELYGINRLGTVETAEAITPQTLYEAYNELLRNSEITVCTSGGDFSCAREMLCENLKNIKRNVVKNNTLFVEKADIVNHGKDSENLKQGKLVMGFRMGMTDESDNYAARRIAVDIFGGTPSSKLFTVVREKMSLCYYCSARMLRHKGIMFVQCGIETRDAQKAENAILEQLDAVRNGDFTDEEIAAAVRALEDGFKGVADSPEALDGWFTSQIITGDYLYPEDYINKFKSVTREQIIEAANGITLDTVFMLEGNSQDGEDE